jgi:lipopolysaccharide export system protein LptA
MRGLTYASLDGHWRLASDLLITPYDVPADQAGLPDANKITWQGHVVVDHGADAARADYAVFDLRSNTLTLTGHVTVDKGRWSPKLDKLVIEAKGLWRLAASARTPDRTPALHPAKADPSPRGARRGDGALPEPTRVSAERVTYDDDQDKVEWIGHARMTSGGRVASADRLDLYSFPADGPGDPGIRKAEWNGHVVFDSDERAVSADQAVYDGASQTITLSGHVVVERGPGVVRNDRLVIDARDW